MYNAVKIIRASLTKKDNKINKIPGILPKDKIKAKAMAVLLSKSKIITRSFFHLNKKVERVIITENKTNKDCRLILLSVKQKLEGSLSQLTTEQFY